MTELLGLGQQLESTASNKGGGTTPTTKSSAQKKSASLKASLRNTIQSQIDYLQMKAIYKIPLLELIFDDSPDSQIRGGGGGGGGSGGKNISHHSFLSKTRPLKEVLQIQRQRQQATVNILFCVRQAG